MKNLYYVLLLTLLVFALALQGFRTYSLSHRVAENRESLADCQQIAKRILAAQEAPELAAETEQSQDELARRIESWTAQASISSKQVLRIDPLAPRRLEDSDYLLEGADIELRNLTLHQLASFSSAIEREDPRLKISWLRLSTPRSESSPTAQSSGASELWQGELALTYLLHSPKSSRRN